MAEDLAHAETCIQEQLGLDLCYRDPGVATFGLANALFPIGDKLLEVVSPQRPNTTAGRLLEKRKGDGGYMVILQVDDLEEMRRRFAATAARIVFEAKIEGITGLHLHPRDLGGAIVSVDQASDWSAWPWAGPSWQPTSSGKATDLLAVEIQAEEPDRMAARWAEVLGCQAIERTIRLDEGEIRFLAPGNERGDGVCGVELEAPDLVPKSFELLGCNFTMAGAKAGD